MLARNKNAMPLKAKDLKLDVSTEGRKLLDAYSWFRDPWILGSIVGAVEETLSLRSWKKNITILGIGSGTGVVERAVGRMMADRGFDVRLLISDKLNGVLSQGQEGLSGRIVMDNKHMPIRDKSVDLVIARSVTHYEDSLEDEKRVLSEIRRILVDGGYFIDQVPVFASPVERDLLKDIHATLPKMMNFQTDRETRGMLAEVFGGHVRAARSQAGRALSVTKSDFIKRYEPAGDKYERKSEYLRSRWRFNQKLKKIIRIIQSVREEERPNVWVGEDDFGWSISYVTFQCLVKHGQKKSFSFHFFLDK